MIVTSYELEIPGDHADEFFAKRVAKPDINDGIEGRVAIAHEREPEHYVAILCTKRECIASLQPSVYNFICQQNVSTIISSSIHT